jgi:hypothetical protein
MGENQYHSEFRRQGRVHGRYPREMLHRVHYMNEKFALIVFIYLDRVGIFSPTGCRRLDKPIRPSAIHRLGIKSRGEMHDSKFQNKMSLLASGSVWKTK